MLCANVKKRSFVLQIDRIGIDMGGASVELKSEALGSVCRKNVPL